MFLFMNRQTCLLSLRTVEMQCTGTVRIMVPSPNDGKEGFRLLDKLELISLMREQRFRIPCTACVPPSRCGCRSTRKGAMRRLLQRIASAESRNSGNPLQPEPPRFAAARPTHKRTEGVRGGSTFCFPPAALRRFRRAKAALCCKSILHGRRCISKKTNSSMPHSFHHILDKT